MDKNNQGVLSIARPSGGPRKRKEKKDGRTRIPQVLLKRSRRIEELIRKQFIDQLSRKPLILVKTHLPNSGNVIPKSNRLVDVPFLHKQPNIPRKRGGAIPKPQSSEGISLSISLQSINNRKGCEVKLRRASVVDNSSISKPLKITRRSSEVISKPASIVDISSLTKLQTIEHNTGQVTPKSASSLEISYLKEAQVIVQQSTEVTPNQENYFNHSQLGETIVKDCAVKNIQEGTNNLNSPEVNKQQIGEALTSEESCIDDNILPEKPVENMREIRKISLSTPQTANNPDVPFTLPVIKITIGGNAPKVIANRSDPPNVNIESPAKVVDETNNVVPDITRTPRTSTKWTKKTTPENVLRVTTKSPNFRSAVLGADTLDRHCLFKKIRLCHEWKQSTVSIDRPNSCTTPATASSGYTSECDSSETPPALLSNNPYSFDHISPTVTAHKIISPHKSESPPVIPPPICITVPNNVESTKICFDIAKAKRQVDFEQNSWASNTPMPSPQRRVMFKTPQLPNTKRPPTRIKSPTHTTTNSLKQFQHSHTQQDDVISIFAGSEILGDDQSVMHHQPRSPDPFEDNKMTFPDFECDEQDETPVEVHVPENPIIEDWIASTLAENQWNLKRTLECVCRNFLQNGTCYRKFCNFTHEIPSVFNDLESLSENDFLMVLDFAVSSKSIFIPTFDRVLNYMFNHGRQDLILHFVSDIMKIQCNKMPYIQKIICKLKNIGRSFEQAVGDIILTTGSSNECLLDILLSFAVDEDSCIVDHWCLIKKLISFRKQKLDNGVVSDIFKKCVELDPPNRNLCENMYLDLCIMCHFNLKEVDRTIILKYIALLSHFRFHSYAVYILHNYGITMDEVRQYIPLESPKNTTEEVSALISTDSVPADQKGGEEGDKVEEVAPECWGNNENVDNEWNELDLMEEERVQRECISHKAITQASLPYFQDQINDAHTSTSFPFRTNNWPFSNLCEPDITVPPPAIRPSSLDGSGIRSANSVKTIELADDDIILLVDAIKGQDMSCIFSLMRKYYEPYKIMKSFVGHIITALKKLPSIENSCAVVTQIYKCLGEDYIFMKDKKMVDMLRLLGFNLLPLLDEERCYKTACEIIDSFSKDLNAFISVECFKMYEFLTSRDLKYIFIFKIFSRSLRYKDAIRLLKQRELKLLDCLLILDKKRFVYELIDNCLKNSISDAKDVIVFFMLNSRVEPAEDMITYLNMLMEKMINGYPTFKDDLINMYDNIVNSWYKYMKMTILRAYFITIYYDLSDTKILEFFDLCIDLGIYPVHEGTENSITLPSNLVSEEIYLIVHYHLYKIVQSKFPINNLIIKAEDYLPNDEYSDLMTVLIHSKVPYSDMVRRIIMVLKKLRSFPSVQRMDIQEQYIILPFNELQQFLRPYSLDKLPPLSKIR